MINKDVVTALKLFVFLTVITGVLYPALITGIAQGFFSEKAQGSIVFRNEKAVGSELIGQEFNSRGFFRSRPSVNHYNPMPSSATNAGPTSRELADQVQQRKLRGDDFDLLYTSASGLDPHISPQAAALQIRRISQETDLHPDVLLQLIKKNTEAKTFGFLGDSRVNVLRLNLDLVEALEAKR